MVVLNVVVEDERGNMAELDDAERWKTAFELDFTVLADTQGDWVSVWGNSGSSTFNQHSYTIIDSSGRVAWHQDGWTGTTDEAIIQALEGVP